MLFVDGEYSYGEVYTEEAWQNGGEPSYIQRRGDFFLPDDSEIPTGRVQLLPDACIVKIPDRDYWSEDVQAMTKRIFAVYALDRRQHFHLCELCASYELWFIEHQYEPTDEVDQDDDKREELNELILEGGRYEEQVIYEHRKDIDPMFCVVAVAVLAGCPGRPWRRLPCSWPTVRDVGRRDGRDSSRSRCNSDI